MKRPAVEPRGHAIEARICAEDPANGFLPQAGRLARVRWPSGPGIRVDAGVESGSAVPPHYDSLLGKVIAWGTTREHARARLVGALCESLFVGVATNVPFLIAALDSERFAKGDYHVTSVGEGAFDVDPAGGEPPSEVVALASAFEQAPVVRRGVQPGATRTTPWDAPDGFRIVRGAANG
jgi:acetyl/propionyl-CoA carboxylase alpha subunit